MSRPQRPLYDILPAIHRIRDADNGHALEALVKILEGELEALRADVGALHDDAFIETCADWVVPYLGELLGVRGLDAERPRPYSQRAFVANTLAYRRRKGTVSVVGQLARDVTRWGAHAAEGFERIGWTQHLNHVRTLPTPRTDLRDPPADNAVGTLNLRDLDAVDRLDGPFDVASHTVDVRPISRRVGWSNLRVMPVFLWRLNAYPLHDVVPRPARGNTHGWHLSPLRNPAPLFHDPELPPDGRGAVTELHVPGPIRPVAFHAELARHAAEHGHLPLPMQPDATDRYGAGKSFHLVKDGVAVKPGELLCKDLSEWARPPAGKVAIDVRLSRVTFAAGEEPAVLRAAYTYGFSADLGSGPYDRRATLAKDEDHALVIDISRETHPRTFQQALALWEGAGRPDAILRVHDNGNYGGLVRVTLPPGGRLVIEAANGRRPATRFIGNMEIRAPPEGARLTLDGFLAKGGIETWGPLDLRLRHMTIVPGRHMNDDGSPRYPDRDSVIMRADADEAPELTVDRAIVGPLRVPRHARHLRITDSIIQAPPVRGIARPAIAETDDPEDPGPPTTIERSTLLGAVTVRELVLASNAIFTDTVRAERTQAGCVRYSHVPEGSRTPRRHECQPDLALKDAPASEHARIRARLRPVFTSDRFGDPAYAQLAHTCAPEIRTGGEHGSEMGAFHMLHEALREADLRDRLDEYLPVGMTAGLVHVT